MSDWLTHDLRHHYTRLSGSARPRSSSSPSAPLSSAVRGKAPSMVAGRERALDGTRGRCAGAFRHGDRINPGRQPTDGTPYPKNRGFHMAIEAPRCASRAPLRKSCTRTAHLAARRSRSCVARGLLGDSRKLGGLTPSSNPPCAFDPASKHLLFSARSSPQQRRRGQKTRQYGRMWRRSSRGMRPSGLVGSAKKPRARTHAPQDGGQTLGSP